MLAGSRLAGAAVAAAAVADGMESPLPAPLSPPAALLVAPRRAEETAAVVDGVALEWPAGAVASRAPQAPAGAMLTAAVAAGTTQWRPRAGESDDLDLLHSA